MTVEIPCRTWSTSLLLLMVFVLGGVLAPEASAQRRQGQIFNAELFNIGGVGVRDDPDLEATRGSVGCGQAWGDGLTAILNAELGQNLVGEEVLPLGQRRELWRFCDAMTNEGGGWDVNTVISPEQEAEQNRGYAPAEMFGQADVAQSIAGWQVTAVANRVQQVRTAMRNREADASYALTRRRGRQRVPWILPAASALAPVPMNFAEVDMERKQQGIGTIAASLNQGVSLGKETLGIDGLGVFLSGRYVRLEADTTSRELGSTTNGGGFTLGSDVRIGPNVLIGSAFGYNHYKTDFARNGGSSEVDDYAGMLFGSVFFGEVFYLDATLRGSYLETDIVKKTPTLDGGPDFSDQKSDPDGWTVASDIGAGGDFAYGAFVLNPYARFGVYHTKIDGFTEKGGDGSMSLVIEKQKVTSLPMTLGASVVYYVSTPFGVVAPYVRGEYKHEFKDQAATVKGYLKVIPEARFRLKPNSTDRNYGSLGTGASMRLKRGWSGYVDYDALVGFSALESHTATAGIRKEL